MGHKPTLYELLGVSRQAGVPEIQAAYQNAVRLLDSRCGELDFQAFNEAGQLLRVALDTLTDPIARHLYDAKIWAQSPERSPTSLVQASPAPEGDGQAKVASARADALALRADALALRADAMMIRSGVDAQAMGAGGAAQVLATGAATVLRRFVSIVGLLAIVGIGFFLLARQGQGRAPEPMAQRQSKAQEQVILQEYYQAHGVRPSSLAEMELLEAERRRRGNEDKLGKQDRDKQEREAKQFEEESRKIAERATTELRQAEESARREAERQVERERIEAQRKVETERQKAEAEQRRLERQEAQWQAVLRR